MARSAVLEIDNSGYDSFLDVVANLVGILLILIVVVGVRTRDVWKQVEANPQMLATLTTAGTTVPELRDARDLHQAKSELQGLQANTFELDHQAQQVSTTKTAKTQERDHLQLLVAAAEKALSTAKTSLDRDQAERLEAAQAVEQARAEVEQLRRDIDAAKASTGTPKVLDHQPTPLAKTVFGQEEHFRLLNGRIVYVPLNDLIEKLKVDAENKLWKLKHVDEITETLPAQDGFRLKYTMQRRQRREMTPAGPVMRTTVELDRFVLLPLEDNPGQTLAEALRDGSPFRRRISACNSSETTITVWTYPDSFTEFRQLKEFLAKQGFLTAGRPLPAGFPIGGSPEGNRSSAE